MGIESKKTTNDALCVFGENTIEYQRLKAAAETIQAFTGKECIVHTTHFDIGQNWKYTTVLMESGMQAFTHSHIFSPKDQFNIVYGDVDLWFETVKEIISKH